MWHEERDAAVIIWMGIVQRPNEVFQIGDQGAVLGILLLQDFLQVPEDIVGIASGDALTIVRFPERADVRCMQIETGPA